VVAEGVVAARHATPRFLFHGSVSSCLTWHAADGGVSKSHWGIQWRANRIDVHVHRFLGEPYGVVEATSTRSISEGGPPLASRSCPVCSPNPASPANGWGASITWGAFFFLDGPASPIAHARPSDPHVWPCRSNRGPVAREQSKAAFKKKKTPASGPRPNGFLRRVVRQQQTANNTRRHALPACKSKREKTSK